MFYDVQPGDHNAALLMQSYYDMRADLPSTPRETKQRWVEALTWVRGVSGLTGWVHCSANECAAAPDYAYVCLWWLSEFARRTKGLPLLDCLTCI